MTTATEAVVLGTRFARELPELAVPWRAAEAPEPRLLVLDDAVAADLGLDPEWLRTPAGLRFLLGLDLPDTAQPVAQGYSGHQFGHLSPRLGDGRALLLGEFVDGAGRERDLHLKGSGRTPFSRGGDGYAVVGPMLREYVVSAAMHALGIPTTRSLAVVATGRPVYREKVEPGAVLARVAASHLRVGSFQYVRLLERNPQLAPAGPVDTDGSALLRRLADRAIARHHPAAADDPQPYLALLRAVIAAQADLVARWMQVGFIHGVMNTDNMTISGETIDYGPCAFLDAFDPNTVFSSIDTAGRYAYGNQPAVAQWNLARFAEALLPLLADDEDTGVEMATDALGGFGPAYDAAFAAGMARKLGLPPGLDAAAARDLIEGLLGLLATARADWTGTFRALSAAARGDRSLITALLPGSPAVDAWLDRWLALGPDPDAMDGVNPVYIPRNHLLEEALATATAGDLDPLHALLAIVTSPYEERAGAERYAAPDPTGGAGYRTFCGT